MNVNTWLPVFPGFYGTYFESEDKEVSEIDYINSERKEKGLSELDFDRFDFDYKEYMNDASISACEFIEAILIEKNCVTEVNFQSVSSPKYYNFSNDSINIEVVITEDNFKTIAALIIENINLFKEYLKDNYTSYDGFISHYSNDSVNWLTDMKDTIQGSHECGAVLNFIVCCLCDLEDPVYEMYCLNDAYIYVENCKEVKNMEYCPECCEWVDPSVFNGDCCNDCNDFYVQNFDKIVCICCKEQILNKWDIRELTYKLKHGQLKPNKVKCSDCECITV